MTNDIFISAVRTAGDLVGIFECDSGGGYFYLFDMTQGPGKKGRAVIRVNPSDAGIQPSDVSVQWNAAEDIVGLYIDAKLWAAFDQHGRKYGGDYNAREAPSIPAAVIERFSESTVHN